jgi:phage terminase small subunit
MNTRKGTKGTKKTTGSAKKNTVKKQNDNNTLTAKQQKFCEEYLIDLNATQAYLRAGYKAKDENTAYAAASRLLRNVKVKAVIDKLMAAREERTETKQDDVLKELSTIAFSKITDFLSIKEMEVIVGYEKDVDGDYDYTKPIKQKMKVVDVMETSKMDKRKLAAISEIRQTKDGISIKLHDKVKTLELLGKHLNMFTENLNISGNLNVKKLEEYF